VQKGVRKTTLKLFFFAILMFGFGYAMVPLYDVFCDITGINGKTSRVVENKIKVMWYLIGGSKLNLIQT